MKKEMYNRAIKLLLRQARYDMPKRMCVKFPVAYVVGNRLFLTEDAAKGWPHRRDVYIEQVFYEDAEQMAKECPWIVTEIREERKQPFKREGKVSA